MRERFRLVVIRRSVQRNINLQALRSGGFRKALQPKMLEDGAQPHGDLCTLDHISRRTGIEIENHHGRAIDIFGQRKRWVQFERGKVGDPYQGRHVICQNVVDGSFVAVAPDRRRLNPLGTMLGRIFLEKEFLVHATWVALHSERLPTQVGQEDRCDSNVVVDDLALGETSCGIKDLVQVRQFELLVFYFDYRRIDHGSRMVQSIIKLAEESFAHDTEFGKKTLTTKDPKVT